jgi:hypothetical protein
MDSQTEYRLTKNDYLKLKQHGGYVYVNDELLDYILSSLNYRRFFYIAFAISKKEPLSDDDTMKQNLMFMASILLNSEEYSRYQTAVRNGKRSECEQFHETFGTMENKQKILSHLLTLSEEKKVRAIMKERGEIIPKLENGERAEYERLDKEYRELDNKIFYGINDSKDRKALMKINTNPTFNLLSASEKEDLATIDKNILLTKKPLKSDNQRTKDNYISDMKKKNDDKNLILGKNRIEENLLKKYDYEIIFEIYNEKSVLLDQLEKLKKNDKDNAIKIWDKIEKQKPKKLEILHRQFKVNLVPEYVFGNLQNGIKKSENGFPRLFSLYGPLPANQNIIIVNNNDYIIYTKQVNIGVFAYYKFNHDDFTVTKINEKKYRNIKRHDQEKTIEHMAIFNIIIRNFGSSWHDADFATVYRMYHDVINVIPHLMYYTHYDYRSDTGKYENKKIYPNLHTFLNNIFNYNIGEFTKKNNNIYTMISANKMKVLIDAIMNPSKEQETINVTDGINIINTSGKIDRNRILNSHVGAVRNANNKIKTVLYDKLKNDLPMLTNYYNYYSMTNLDNSISMSAMKNNLNNTVTDFLDDLSEFIETAIEAKAELKSMHSTIRTYKFYREEEQTNFYYLGDNMFMLLLFSYFVHVIKEKNGDNIFLNLDDVIIEYYGKDQFKEIATDIQREKPKDYQYIVDEATNIIHWIKNNITGTKKNYILMKQYSDIKPGESPDEFPSCGETTTLNLINYILLNANDNVFSQPVKGNKKVKAFYGKYPTINNMEHAGKRAVEEWGEVVSGYHGVTYSDPEHQYELKPLVDSIVILLSHLFPGVVHKGDGLCDAVSEISDKTIDIANIVHTRDKNSNYVLTINGQIAYYFKPNHAYSKYVADGDDIEPTDLQQELQYYIKNPRKYNTNHLLATFISASEISNSKMIQDRIFKTFDVLGIIIEANNTSLFSFYVCSKYFEIVAGGYDNYKYKYMGRNMYKIFLESIRNKCIRLHQNNNINIDTLTEIIDFLYKKHNNKYLDQQKEYLDQQKEYVEEKENAEEKESKLQSEIKAGRELEVLYMAAKSVLSESQSASAT